ncbi:crossover junction endodeoxyribonuclease RuvC [bacterium]|nr:crossover junction endodeoxyribonuclease RuvC [bacterium]
MWVMRVLGIDPGLRITGYGLVQFRGARVSVVEAGVVRSDSADSLADRVRTIYLQLRDIIREFEPDVLAVEELYSHYKHPVTSILMGHARGVLFLAAAEAGLPVESYAATRVKKALTGSGRASKEQVQRMVQSTLGLAELPEPADVSDALAVALCHANVLMHSAVR